LEAEIMTNLTGQTLGQYQIHEELGRGGMATVYRATQTTIGRDVAIKVLPSHFLQDTTFLERFSREVRVIAQVQHRSILPVYDFGERDGMPYIVMAYMAGGPLSDYMRQHGRMSLDDTVRIVEQIAEGLDHAHSKGIIHRDFKPSNVLLDEYSNAFLADFGIAKIEEATAHLTGSAIIGTPAYMSPERYENVAISGASDIYALGITAYQMLSGAHPFNAESPTQWLRAHLYDPVPDIRAARSDLPVTVQPVLERSLAKDPAQRYQQATVFAADLKQAATSGATAPAPPPAPSPDLGGPTIPMDEPVAQLETPPPHVPTVPKPDTDPTVEPTPVVPEEEYATIPTPPEPSAPVAAARPAAVARSEAAAPSVPIWQPLLIVAIGWAVIGAIFAVVHLPSIFALGLFAIAGVVVGLALRWVERSSHWQHVLAIGIGWTIALFLLGSLLGWGGVLIEPGWPVLPVAISAALIGTFVGVVLRWARSPLGWTQVPLIALGWAASFPIASFVERVISQFTPSLIYLPLYWAVAGAIGSAVTFWVLGRAQRATEASHLSSAQPEGAPLGRAEGVQSRAAAQPEATPASAATPPRPAARIETATPVVSIWPLMLLVAIGWAALGYVYYLGLIPGIFEPGLLALAGVIVGLTLRWREPAIRWGHILAVGVGWGLTQVILGWFLYGLRGEYLTEPIHIPLPWQAIGGALIGAAVGAILRWARSPIQWTHVPLFILSWGISYPLASLAARFIYDLTGGHTIITIVMYWALAGTIGSTATFWLLGRAQRAATS
jgi:serine/threonine protein kinase